MYQEYWQLKEPPFENVPDPKFIYFSAEHEEALTRLLYAIKARKGAAMLTGDVGAGKTTLSRVLIQSLPVQKYEVAVITNPDLSPLEFLKEILHQLGIDEDLESKVDILHRLNEELFKNVRAEKDTVIVIDEAQAIQDFLVLEEIRLLLNFQLNERFLITLIIIGQPELKEITTLLPQLDQRIAIRYHLGPLSFEDTVQYIEFRLKIAGSTRKIFTDGALEKIYEYSKGIPRKINNICDLSLLVGFSARAKEIDSQIVTRLIDDIGGDRG